MGRLTPEREASIREAHRDNGPIDDCWMCNVIGEIDALRAESERLRGMLRDREEAYAAVVPRQVARIAELEKELDFANDSLEAAKRNGATLSKELAAVKAQREAVIAACAPALRYPDNGVHYCRWCGNATRDRHIVGCHYVSLCNDIDVARKAITNARSEKGA